MKTRIRGALIGCLAAGLAANGGLAAERKVTLEVGKLSCGGCRYIVKKTLAKVPGVSRCLVQANDRLVVLVGIHDTVVVDTDDALLVCHRDSTQQVKNVVDYLHAHQLDEYV